MRPIRGRVYTLREIVRDLELLDAPSLGFADGVIQDAHCTCEQLLAVPGLADTEWKYICTTHEWIPVFKAVNNDEVRKCVDVVFYGDVLMRQDYAWITPIGLSRPLTADLCC